MLDSTSHLNAALEGRYRVERELGEGGMATVYLAVDLRHERQVALKVLKPELAAVVGAERFLAEIKTTANLQHPHILPLYDSGEAGGLLFYVMPYVRGESLRERLEREHQLPLDDAILIATNMAEALDHAHRQGVIHRDVKPANVLLQDGKPVISDFGIALAVSAGGGSRLTETGLSVGTPHYMSPEQATGDSRIGVPSDIWSAGCVLYEMLLGEPPFTGSTPQAVLGKIITGDVPSMRASRASVPQNVDAVVAKALEKVPADRFATAAQMAAALSAPGFRWSSSADPTGPQGADRWRTAKLVLAAVVTALAGGLIGSALFPRRMPQSPPPRHAQALLPTGVVPQGSWGGSIAITGDGSRIVYLARTEGGGSEIRSRLLTERASDVPIAGTQGAAGLFVSPDGEFVAFHDPLERRLKRVPIGGGTPVPIVRTDPAGTFVGGAWGNDGTIVYATTMSGLQRVSAEGGVPEEMTEAGERTPVLHFDPSFLPDGSGVVFSVADVTTAEDRTFRIAVLRFGGEVVELTEVGEGHSPTVTDQGLLVYSPADRGSLYGGELWAVRLSGDWLRLAGAPVRVMAEAPVRFSVTVPRIPYALGRDGSLVYLPDAAVGRLAHTLVWVDREGRPETILSQQDVPNAFALMIAARLSPDGSRVVFRSNLTNSGRNFGLFVWDLQRSALTIIPGEANADWPVWWGNDRLVFTAFDLDAQGLYWTAADGQGLPEPLDSNGEAQRHAQEVVADGRVLIYQERPSTNHPDSDIWMVSVGHDEEPKVIVDDAGAAVQASVDPTGRWLAYSSNVSGMQEVYVTEMSTGSALVKVSEGGGSSPVWNPVGEELLYRRGREFWAAKVSAAESFRVDARDLLFTGDYVDCCDRGGWGRSFDVSPDGRRLLLVRQERVDRGIARLEWVQGWMQHAARQLGNR